MSTSVPSAPLPPTSTIPIRSPKVYGVLSIVFSSIMILMSLIGSCGGFAGASLSGVTLKGEGVDAAGAAAFEAVKGQLADVYTASGVTSLMFLVLSALLLAIGIGQLGYRRWARAWSVYWGVAALVGLVVNAIIWIAWIGPAYESAITTMMAMSEHAGRGPQVTVEGIGGLAGAGAAIFSIAIFAPYPILQIANFSRKVVRDVMTR
ncbi:MAG: hypothetical protein KC635_11115 [Myxococcales bacterium]|nr:hypothetical protein [Myxococcales bacterium]MCB9731743.1 hypothetical protein [Deltaproteobacteria bacterium]